MIRLKTFSVCLMVLVCSAILSTPVAARVTGVEFEPAVPLADTPFIIKITGELPDQCWLPDVTWSSVSRVGNILTMAIIVREDPDCVPTRRTPVVYHASQESPPLPPGRYALLIIEYHNSPNFPDPEFFVADIEVFPGAELVHVPTDKPTIQEGIDAVRNGGTVLVADGIYQGIGNNNLDFHGKSILLKSEDGPDVTIIDCLKSRDPAIGSRGFVFHSGEGPDAIVSGLTIRNGKSPRYGGGIYCDGASPRIEDCIFTENQAGYFGGAIYCCNDAAPEIIDCVFKSNAATAGAAYAGAIGGETCSPRIENCVFKNNTAGGYGGALLFKFGGDPVIKNCLFESNQTIHGGAIGHYSVSGSYEGCVFIDNSASQKGGAAFLQDNCSPSFENCTFFNNSGDIGGVFFIEQRFQDQVSSPSFTNVLVAFNTTDDAFVIVNGTPTFSCTDIYGNVADWNGYLESFYGSDGNISEDPLFCDTATDNLGIAEDSPCAPENNSCQALIGAVGVECDGIPTGTDDDGQVPAAFALNQNYPNPFNPSTTVTYVLPHASQVKIIVFNLLGQQVRTLVDDYKLAGEYETIWDGADDAGQSVASGVYFYTLTTAGFNATRKMVLLK